MNIPFHYIGTHGYYEDTGNRLYVRARYYRADLGNWITQDPLWPQEPAYAYVKGNPINNIDPSGKDIFQNWANSVYPPGAGIPNWIIPDQHKIRCVKNPNPFNWEYGNCCGYNKKCNMQSKTYDCLDYACKVHDECWGTVSDFIKKPIHCNKKFCNDIHFCFNRNCKGRKIDHKQCQALFEAGTLYCALAGEAGPSGLP